MKLYHGTEKEFETFLIPSFFSTDEFVSSDYGDVTEYNVELNKSCKISDILEVAEELCLSHSDVIEYRNETDIHNRNIQYAENNDFLYIPSVVSALKDRGFDSFCDNPICDGEVLGDETEIVLFFELTK